MRPDRPRGLGAKYRARNPRNRRFKSCQPHHSDQGPFSGSLALVTLSLRNPLRFTQIYWDPLSVPVCFMPDSADSVRTGDGDKREEEWLRLAQLKSRSPGQWGTTRPRYWTRTLASTGMFFIFFGLWWLRYIWSVAGLLFIFSIGGLLLVFAPIGVGVLLLVDAAREKKGGGEAAVVRWSG
jgi:hypothetical protein